MSQRRVWNKNRSYLLPCREPLHQQGSHVRLLLLPCSTTSRRQNKTNVLTAHLRYRYWLSSNQGNCPHYRARHEVWKVCRAMVDHWRWTSRLVPVGISCVSFPIVAAGVDRCYRIHRIAWHWLLLVYRHQRHRQSQCWSCKRFLYGKVKKSKVNFNNICKLLFKNMSSRDYNLNKLYLKTWRNSLVSFYQILLSDFSIKINVP